MKNTIKSIMALSIPTLILCAIFNVTIIKTIKETKTMRSPALEKTTYTAKIVSL